MRPYLAAVVLCCGCGPSRPTYDNAVVRIEVFGTDGEYAYVTSLDALQTKVEFPMKAVTTVRLEESDIEYQILCLEKARRAIEDRRKQRKESSHD